MEQSANEYRIEDFGNLHFLAEGTFSKVFSVTHLPTGRQFALKRGSKEKLMGLKVQDRDTFEHLDGLDLFYRETEVIRLIRECPEMQPHFPQFVYGYEDEGHIYEIMELSTIGTPLNFDDQKCRYVPNPRYETHRLANLRKGFTQMAQSLRCFHDLRMAHMDLKVENFLAYERPDGPPDIKLIDFNGCRVFKDAHPKTCNQYGSLFYLPPEYYDSLDGYDPFKADVYALGVCFFIISTTELPYTASKDPDQEPFQDVVYEGNVSEQAVDLSRFTPAFASLLADMLTKDPSERLTATGVIDRLQKLDPKDPLVAC